MLEVERWKMCRQAREFLGVRPFCVCDQIMINIKIIYKNHYYKTKTKIYII